MLNVTKSGYHSWRIRPHARKQDDQVLLGHITAAHQATVLPEFTADLNAKGVRCSRRRVARPMRSMGLYGKGKRKYKKTTDSDHVLRVAENLVQRNFDVAQPNTVWAGDQVRFYPVNAPENSAHAGGGYEQWVRQDQASTEPLPQPVSTAPG